MGAEDKAVADEKVKLAKDRWPKVLFDVLEVLESLYIRQGMDEAVAHELAGKSTLEMARYFGGRQLYLPTGEKLERAIRDKYIFKVFNGKNADELATKFSVTTASIYRLHKEQRALYQQGRT